MDPLFSADTHAMATDRNGASTLWDRLQSVEPRLLALVAGIGILTCAYWPNLQYLYTIWENEPNYSHGVLVIPIALVISGSGWRTPEVSWTVSKGPWWSWVVLMLILAARAFAYEQQFVARDRHVHAGRGLSDADPGRLATPEARLAGCGLSLFMLPLPQFANNMISLPLQRIATLGSVFVMQLTGLRAWLREM